LARIN